MIALYTLLLSTVFANDALDKKLFLLKRAIKNNDCGQGLEMADKLIEENPDYKDFWMIKAEFLECLEKDPFSVYLSYERYVELSGSDPNALEKMRALEKELYSVRIHIGVEKGDVPIWSQLSITMDSDRWTKEADGVYLLKYSPPQEYKISVVSFNPLVESADHIVSGQGFEEKPITLQSFEAASLSIADYPEKLSLEIYPANSPNVPFVGSTGQHEIGAGSARIIATFNGKTTEYQSTFSAGENELLLPWMYEVKYGQQILHHDIASPEKQSIENESIKIKSPFNEETNLLISFSIAQKLGKIQTVQIDKDQFEKSALAKEMQHYDTLLSRQQKQQQLRSRLTWLGFTELTLAGGVQYLALSKAEEANSITDRLEYEQFQRLSNNASLAQWGAIGLGTIGISSLAITSYLKSKKTLQKEIKSSQKKIDSLQKTPIVIQAQ